MIITEQAAKRFWAKVTLPDSNGCMMWTAYCDKNGYGRITLKNDVGQWRPMQAHRMAWLIEHGEWPGELDHLCKNQGCVRIDHLEDVAHRVNMQRHYGDTCREGHSDWYTQPSTGRRRCRTCFRINRRKPKSC